VLSPLCVPVVRQEEKSDGQLGHYECLRECERVSNEVSGLTAAIGDKSQQGGEDADGRYQECEHAVRR
jgi:hypothetical protein